MSDRMLCATCAKCKTVDSNGYITCIEFPRKADAEAAGMTVFLHCFCDEWGQKVRKSSDDMWSYSKLAYWLDVAEVIWPLVDNIRGAGLETTEDLLKAFVGGKFSGYSHATKRGVKQVANLLCNLYKDDQKDINAAYKRYVTA